MIFAIKYPDSLIVCSATKLEEYELFRQGQHDFPDGARSEIADFIGMLSDERLVSFGIAPLVIECDNTQIVDRLIGDFNFEILLPKEGRDHQLQMIEAAKKEAALDLPRDRRSIEEIHGLDVEDRWDKNDEETKAKHREVADEFRKKREEGSVTGDSFGGIEKDKLVVQDIKVKVNKDDEILAVDVKAHKTNLRPYRLEIHNEPDFDFVPLFDAFHIPQNRVESAENGVAILNIHTHQVALFTTILEQRGHSFTFESIGEEEPVIEDAIDGHDDLSVFFTVQSAVHKAGDLLTVLGDNGVDVSTVVSMKDVSNGCWLAFRTEKKAKDASRVLDDNGYATSVVAINRKGQSIVGGDGDADNYRIVDTSAEEIVSDPRPWNSRSDEWDAMTDDEKAEAIKGIKASEFLFVVEANPVLHSVAYFTPESYLIENDKMWGGELPIEHLFGKDVLDPYDKGIWTCKTMAPELVIANINNWGFVESLRLRIHLNNERHGG